MPLMLESTTLLNDNTIDLIIGVGTVYLTLTKRHLSDGLFIRQLSQRFAVSAL